MPDGVLLLMTVAALSACGGAVYAFGTHRLAARPVRASRVAVLSAAMGALLLLVLAVGAGARL
ncbi:MULTISPECIES: hypothetical protein [unclassified Micromonospora]|uniref:hypothetical protein n=1 Tax=unclassified Micromonospora TaxID=2617518 RepID=UPI002FEEDD5E